MSCFEGCMQVMANLKASFLRCLENVLPDLDTHSICVFMLLLSKKLVDVTSETLIQQPQLLPSLIDDTINESSHLVDILALEPRDEICFEPVQAQKRPNSIPERWTPPKREGQHKSAFQGSSDWSSMSDRQFAALRESIIADQARLRKLASGQIKEYTADQSLYSKRKKYLTP
eukprot:Protomagalhaensia_sp_Gyna_25__5228@NODE_634_length_2955_cov_53_686900_g493_i0_p3_GENE_NODE_634_length_2955_cov_53_686900_g493_i0NODE_634_length_2955_cov_53_686900_g493_i0_p3_ORF_typecomplete_len173_score19_09_NODE_634_length_2955_cov_53_686900_g493_i05211039